MKYDSQADAVLRKTATPLHIKNATNGAFFVCFEGVFGWFTVKNGVKWSVFESSNAITRSGFDRIMELLNIPFAKGLFGLTI